MKVKYIGEYYKFSLINNKVYDVISVEDGAYRIVDETEEDFLFPANEFEIVED